MLKTTKSINFNGTSEIGGSIAATMHADIYDNGMANCSSNIQNVELYEANKTEVRADIDAFNGMVYSIQDVTGREAEV